MEACESYDLTTMITTYHANCSFQNTLTKTLTRDIQLPSSEPPDDSLLHVAVHDLLKWCVPDKKLQGHTTPEPVWVFNALLVEGGIACSQACIKLAFHCEALHDEEVYIIIIQLVRHEYNQSKQSLITSWRITGWSTHTRGRGVWLDIQGTGNG